MVWFKKQAYQHPVEIKKEADLLRQPPGFQRQVVNGLISALGVIPIIVTRAILVR